MIQLVTGLNIAIACCGFYVAWRIWSIKQTLATVVAMLTIWEQNTHQVLNPETTPALILRGQQGTASLRVRYARFNYQLKQLRRLFSIVLVGLRLLGGKGHRQRKRLRFW